MQRRLRLTNRRDFQTVYRWGKSAANSQFVVYYRRNPNTERFRLGISASKKLGNAVVRNRLRRQIKEIVRLHVDQIQPQHDVIIIARKPSTAQDYWQMEKSLLHVLKRAGLLAGRR
ncbi:ribonuclease P protein component [Xylanibacillus composti]|uniref:Ribonuclease P protein component n=1 Tax=Xylanibacillus composti TaxID=1572762 RepID=A0A8J4H378_9BACL|nr:ribonuclease P protein component [Xylanibacillus composti]MDT9725185.1 ribonuclease P protein component [Xylanibacillus composti]GIQ70034.1 ribonuclease P protein component [Xylanibacillus composti]